MTARFRWAAGGIGLTLVAATVALLIGRAYGVQAAAPALVTMAHSQPALAQGRTPTGRLPQQQALTLTFTVQPRNLAGLEHFVAQVATPHAAGYHQFLTPASFARTFGPEPATVQRVLAFAQEAGLHVTRQMSGGMFIDATGTVQQIESAFHTRLDTYLDSQGRTFFANDSNLTLPAAVAPAIVGVTGLDNATMRQHMTTLPRAGKAIRVTKPHTAGCPVATGQNTLVPSQIATAYGFPTNLNGSGQDLALVEFDGYLLSDIGVYASCFAPNATVSSVVANRLVDLATALTPGAGAIEDELDIEVALGMAPGLSKIHVYEAPNTNQGLIDMLAAIANDDADGTVSDSWGSCESDTGFALAASEEMAFLQMAAQGQGVYVAAGDSGAYDCLNDAGSDPYFHGRTISADDPASDPYVTSVGGTTLTVNASTSAYMGETAWNDSTLPSPYLAASDGGFSQFWAAPSWQINAKATTTPGGISDPAGARALPDVSADADPQTGYAEYCTAGAECALAPASWFDIGGTSAAAPLWASLAVLANQKAGGRIGLLTPALYSLYGADTSATKTVAGIALGGTTYYDYTQQENGASVSSGTIVFNDITSGNNTFPSAQGFTPGSSSQTGYDAVSGLGSMQAQAVVNFLQSNLRFTTPRLYMTALGNDKRAWMSGYYLNLGDGNIVPDAPTASNWFPLGSQTFTSAPAISDNGVSTVSLSGNSAQVWVTGTGTDGQIHIGMWNPATTTFGGWQTAPSGASCSGSPATAFVLGKLFIICMTTSGGLVLNSYLVGGNSWGTWMNIGGGLTAPPTMATDGANLLIYAPTAQNDWFNTYAAAPGTLGIWRHMATTCEAAPAVAYTGNPGLFELSCIANDTSTMWANTFDLTSGTLTGWFNLGAPSGIGFHNATSVAVDQLDNPDVLLYTGEGKNNAAYVQVTTYNSYLTFIFGWQSASLPGIFATNAATDYVGA